MTVDLQLVAARGVSKPRTSSGNWASNCRSLRGSLAGKEKSWRRFSVTDAWPPWQLCLRYARLFAKGPSIFNLIIGDLKPDGEEFRCAVFLDEHPAVQFWVRNVDRKPNAFWRQLSGGRFYPDFVAMLTDGRILVVEHKGGHLAEDAREKRMIGQL